MKKILESIPFETVVTIIITGIISKISSAKLVIIIFSFVLLYVLYINASKLYSFIFCKGYKTIKNQEFTKLLESKTEFQKEILEYVKARKSTLKLQGLTDKEASKKISNEIKHLSE